MYKKIYGFLIVLLLLFLSIFSACQDGSVNNNEGVPLLDLEVAEEMNFQPGNVEDFSVKVFDVDVPEEWNLGGAFPYGSKVYYYLDKAFCKIASNSTAEIRVYDLDSATERVVYEYANSEAGLFLNEMKANEDFVFWVVYDGDERRIERYDTEKELVELIETSDAGTPAMLSIDENNLVWFQPLYDETDNDNDELYIYDNDQGKLDQIDVAKSYIPRTIVNEGIVTYITSHDDDYNLINVYDLETKKVVKEFLIENKVKFSRTMANKQYFIFRTPDELDDIYAYDYINDKLYKVNDASQSSVFSFELIDNNLMINDNESQKIIALNLENQTKTQCFDGDEEEFHRFTSSSVSQNKNYVTIDHDFINQQISIVYIEINK